MPDEFEIDRAVFEYSKAYAKLWKQIQENPCEFPSGAISCGSIAEHYTKKYLEAQNEGAAVRFGNSNEKAWDIEVLTSDKKAIKYQVKSVSHFSVARKTTELVKGFDRLIVLSLDCDFFPSHVYLFDDANIFLLPKKIKILTVPDPGFPRRRGSVVFQYAKDIKNDFFEALQ